MSEEKPRRREVALFATCLVDLVRPDIGFDVARLVLDAGFKVVVPPLQTCCGQPNYNGGDKSGAMAMARRNIDLLMPYEYVVVPSGSCGGMIAHHYPELLSGDTVYAGRARRLAERVYELSRFLVDVADYQPSRRLEGTVTYHDACAGLRELGIKSGPRKLLERAGAQVVEAGQAETCCGFGGTFCIKYPDISNAMLERKVADIEATGAATVVAGELGCLMNIEGKLHRTGRPIAARHFAQLLAPEQKS